MKKIVIALLFFTLSFNVMAKVEYEGYNKAFVKLNAEYDLFIGACNLEERLAIITYAKGDLEKMSGGYETVKSLTTTSGKEINDMCANYSEQLYDALKYAEQYIGKSNMVSINLETQYEMKKNIFVSGSKIQSRDDLTIVDDCKLIDNNFKKVLNEFFGYIQIGCVAIAIILSMVDLYKLLISKDMETKKVFKNIRTRIIALVIVLLVPAITNIVLDIINKYVDVDALKCLES